MKNLKISAAVGAAMMMSSGAFALNQADTAAAPVQLVVAGASAARDTFQAEFRSNCVLTPTNTFNTYRAFPVENQDFRAYSCTLASTAAVPAALRGVNATVYYRSEGGSVWGPGSIAKAIPIKRLVVDGTCALGVDTTPGNCAVAGYNIATDGFTSGHLVNALVDLGVADEEPAMYRGENWVGGPLGAEPAAGVLENLTRSTGFGQVFGIAVNTGVTLNNISKQDVASIFAGNYSSWDQVVDLSTGNPGPALEIKVCRREKGSGTQVSAAVFFLQQNCGKSFEPFVTAPNAPLGNPVQQNSTTTEQEDCLGDAATAAPGSIGPNVFKTTIPADNPNFKYLSIDGVAPSKLNAARGTYGYWFETSFAKRPALGSDELTAADFLIARARAVAGIPGTSASAFAIPGVAGNTPVLPVNPSTTATPVAIGTKSGNSCKVPLGQL
jgi:PBP superfamily domain